MEVRKAIYYIFKKHGMGEKFRSQEPLFIWNEVSGETVSGFTQPLLVKNRVLLVRVPNHAIQHELTLLKEKYIEKINHKLAREELKDIRFTVGDINREDINSDPELAVDAIKLTEKEKAELERMVSGLEDEQLKESFTHFLRKLKKIEKTRKKLGWEKCERCGVYHKDENSLCPSCRLELFGQL